jgi:hypothetical protein
VPRSCKLAMNLCNSQKMGNWSIIENVLCFREVAASLLVIILCQLLHHNKQYTVHIIENNEIWSDGLSPHLLLQSEGKRTISGAITYLERSSTTTGFSQKCSTSRVWLCPSADGTWVMRLPVKLRTFRNFGVCSKYSGRPFSSVYDRSKTCWYKQY